MIHNNPEQELGNMLGMKKDTLALFKNAILDQTKEYPPPLAVINLLHNGANLAFLTKKSFSLWQGKQKSKKTTGLAIAVASMIAVDKSSDLIRFECAEPGSVLFFDCEQGQSYAARTMRLVLKLANIQTSDNLIYCDLRELNPSERLEVIEAGIESTPGTKLVVIDGLVDLMVDFMDAKEGHNIITSILKLCSKFDIHIAGVLHQNKGQSKDARAHVGSIASQKCEVEIMVEVDGQDRGQSVITCKESRGLPFEDFAIRWDKGELPRIVQQYIPTKTAAAPKKITLLPADIDKSEHIEILKKVFKKLDKPKWAELSASLKNEINSTYGYNIADAKVRQFVAYYLNEELLYKTAKGSHSYYQVEGPNND